MILESVSYQKQDEMRKYFKIDSFTLKPQITTCKWPAQNIPKCCRKFREAVKTGIISQVTDHNMLEKEF